MVSRFLCLLTFWQFGYVYHGNITVCLFRSYEFLFFGVLFVSFAIFSGFLLLILDAVLFNILFISFSPNKFFNFSASLTKDAIKKSFMKLLSRKQVSKITVKEIVEDCGINRNSFYYHFDDIPSLIEEIFDDQVDELMNRQSGSENIYNSIIDAIDFALQNKTAMMHIRDSASRDLFDRYLNRVAERTVSEFFDKSVPDVKAIDSGDKEAIVIYYKSLIIGFVEEWMADGMKYDLVTKIERICELFEGTTEIALSRCERSEK